MKLIEEYAYRVNSIYVKCTLGYHLKLANGDLIAFTLGKAIPLKDNIDGCGIDKNVVYDRISDLVRLFGERYNDAKITGVFINIYYHHHKEASSDASEVMTQEPISINEILNVMEMEMTGYLPEVKSLLYKQKRIPSHITSLKGKKSSPKRPFIVADLETVVVDTVHTAYAAGYLVVHPSDDLT